MNWFVIRNGGPAAPLGSIPMLPYPDFAAQLAELLRDQACHCVAYFAAPVGQGQGLRLYALVANDRTGEIVAASHAVDYYTEQVESLSATLPALHPFEREIHELFGLRFHNHPWQKPLRYPHNRHYPEATIDTYPFYTMQGGELHQVQVGPVHAGIIEPGAFRFLCNGEQILHLEIALGYQHRGIETLMAQSSRHRLRQIALAESIAGDSVVAHATAAAMIFEAGTRNEILDCERAVALEMERIAMHLADTGALCMDLGYQLGQVVCEALRTLVINTTQGWCGNRFGKGLIRPFGSHYRLDPEQLRNIETTMEQVITRYREVAAAILSNPSILARLEQVCRVTRRQALQVGAVGMAARSSGLERDARTRHNVVRSHLAHQPVLCAEGDLMARLRLRMLEIDQSYSLLAEYCALLAAKWPEAVPAPDYGRALPADSLLVSLVEGWRGEVCHVALTGPEGAISTYKVVDPSLHNWMMLALSVRQAQISDFPVSNKSFNLSYCGHDL